MKHIVEQLKSKSIVKFRPKGNSMTPLIKSGQLVTILSNAGSFEFVVGDIVLCKVKGRIFLHKITAVNESLDLTAPRYQISNNKGHVNGWASTIYGIVTKVED